MAHDLGGFGLKDTYMKLSSLGAIEITVTPTADNKEIMNVDIVAENRLEPMHMTTNKDEAIDQFATRIKSMMRSMWNGLPRTVVEQANPATVPVKTFEEQKKDIKQKAGK